MRSVVGERELLFGDFRGPDNVSVRASAFGGGARWVSSVVFLVGVWWWDGVVLRGIGIPTTRDMCDCGSSERSAPEFRGL